MGTGIVTGVVACAAALLGFAGGVAWVVYRIFFSKTTKKAAKEFGKILIEFWAGTNRVTPSYRLPRPNSEKQPPEEDSN